MFLLKQSTAVDVLIGPFVDKTDGVTAETGESPSVKLSKNGQTLAAKNDVTTPVSDADGYYNCELDATDTNTVGTLALTVAASANAAPIRHEFQVVEETVYDAIYGSGAALNVGSAASVTAGVTLANGAVTNASLAGNMEIVFETDFATNYNTTDNAWVTNGTSFIGTGWNTGKTGYSLTQSFPTNFADMAITVTTGQVTVGTNNDKTGYTASTVSDKTGYSLTVGTGLGNQTADITGNLSGSVGSVTGAVGSVTGAVGSVTGLTASNLDATVSSRMATTHINATAGAVDTVTINTDMRGTNNAALATALTTVDNEVGAIQTDLDNATDGLGALKTLIDAVQTEVNKLTQTAHTEPTGVPAANEAPIDKLGYLFMALRNQVDVTATKKTFYDDGGAAEWEKDLSDNGTTYSESEGNAI